MPLRFYFGFIFFFLCISTVSHAHHTTVSSGSGTRINYLRGNGGKPQSRVGMNYQYSYLDNQAGHLQVWSLEGEWAITKKFSITADTSLLSHHGINVNNQIGIGDFGFAGKLLLIDNPQFLSFLSTRFTAPTGSETKGFGQGHMGHQVDIFGGIKLQEWLLFFVPSASYIFDSQLEPTLNLGLGVTTPRLWDKVVFTLLSHTQILTDSTSYTNGSWKLHVEPQSTIFLNHKNNLTLNLAARLALIDQLSVKPGVILAANSTDLLTDVFFSTSISVNYNF